MRQGPLLTVFLVLGKMDELQQSILALIKKTVPDVNEAKAILLVEHLTSEAVGVRSLERLFDVPLDVISLKVPVCDAVTLHRSWQAKFRECFNKNAIQILKIKIPM